MCVYIYVYAYMRAHTSCLLSHVTASCRYCSVLILALLAAMELDHWDVATVGRWLENAGYGGPSDSVSGILPWAARLLESEEKWVSKIFGHGYICLQTAVNRH